jgi:hypothetical protein
MLGFGLGNSNKITSNKDNARTDKKLNVGAMKAKVSGIDKYWVVTILVFMAASYVFYLAFSQNLNIDEMKATRDAASATLETKKVELAKKEREVKEFVAKVEKEGEKGKKFIPTIDKFGVYKLIIALDDYKKIFPFDYKLTDSEKNLTKIYKYYDLILTVEYRSMDSFKTILSYLTRDYFMDFVDGAYSNGKFVLKYKVYAKKD